MKYILALALISITFCGYKWLPAVSGYSELDDNNGYAGILGRDIVGIKINCGLTFQVHYTGKSSWEAPTSGQGGNLRDKIDGLAIRGGNYYKVFAGGRWLPAVNGYNTNDDYNGYAGILGADISGVMINGCSNYAVAYYVDEGGDTPNIPSTSSQVFVSTGTGVQGITLQYLVPNMKEGCFFMGCCVIGGLGNDAQIQDAYRWALNMGHISSDTFVKINSIEFARLISQKYGTTFHSGWRIDGSEVCGHYWVIDNNGREVFNASGLGYKGRNC